MSSLAVAFDEYGVATLQIRFSDETGLFTCTLKKTIDGQPMFLAASGSTAERSLANALGRTTKGGWVKDKSRRE